MPFDRPTALIHARAAQAVYAGDQEAFREAFGFQRCRSIAAGDDYCLIATRPGAPALVVFRGSANVGNWIDNLDGELASAPELPGQVHRGFLRSILDLWPWLKSYTPRGQPVQVTGHSMGGALATLAAELYAAAGWQVEPVYTFGSPRVGSTAFAVACIVPQLRLVHDLDPVPHLPSGLRFTHVGEEVRLYDDGTIAGEPGLWQRLRHLVGTLRRGPLQMIVESIGDHAIASYVDALALQKGPAAAAA